MLMVNVYSLVVQQIQNQTILNLLHDEDLVNWMKNQLKVISGMHQKRKLMVSLVLMFVKRIMNIKMESVNVKREQNVMWFLNVENLIFLLGIEDILLSGVLKRLVKVQLIIIIV